MTLQRILTLFLVCFALARGQSQVSGTVTDEQGAALPYASVFVHNGRAGATTNSNGQYSLALEPGEHLIVFQYVGYQRVEKRISYNGKALELNMKLTPIEMSLKEVVVSAEQEDPAYAIMRRAIAKRSYYLSKMTDYNCRVYVKGLHKLAGAPDKIFGKNIGNMDGMLDSNRQGVLYLSESFSRLYFAEGGKNVKEVMEQSKVSGADAALNFNRASFTLFTLYQPTTDLGRPILSPLADNAFQYYRFKLEGTWYTEKKQSVARIRLIPKRSNDPVYHGFIEILEDLSSLYSVSVSLTGDNIQQPLLDTLTITQTLSEIRQPDTWATRTQLFSFGFKVFGFKYRGLFTSVFSDYQLGSGFAPEFAKAETFKVNKDIARADSFWLDARPIPLTQEEATDYTRKDSIARIRNSKAWLDSIDRKNNRFKPGDLLFGYTWRNTWKHRRISYQSPLGTLQFNTVQGFMVQLAGTWQQAKDNENTKYWSLSPELQYGHADKRLRPTLSFTKKWNAISHDLLRVKLGNQVFDLNELHPLPPMQNTLFTLFFRKNAKKILEKYFAKIEFERKPSHNWQLNTSVEAFERGALVNHTNYAFKKGGLPVYSSNNPLEPNNDLPAFERHRGLTMRLGCTFQPGTTYSTLGDRREYMESSSPAIGLSYQTQYVNQKPNETGRGILHKFGVSIEQNRIQAGIAGAFSWNIQADLLINKQSAYFPDYLFVQVNPYRISLADQPARQFQLIPVYTHANPNAIVQSHLMHDFRGYLFDKIPLIRKLKFTEQVIVRQLYLPNATLEADGIRSHHVECGFAVSNIGIKAARLFRFEYVLAPPLYTGAALEQKWVIGLATSLQVDVK